MRLQVTFDYIAHLCPWRNVRGSQSSRRRTRPSLLDPSPLPSIGFRLCGCCRAGSPRGWRSLPILGSASSRFVDSSRRCTPQDRKRRDCRRDYCDSFCLASGRFLMRPLAVEASGGLVEQPAFCFCQAKQIRSQTGRHSRECSFAAFKVQVCCQVCSHQQHQHERKSRRGRDKSPRWAGLIGLDSSRVVWPVSCRR